MFNESKQVLLFRRLLYALLILLVFEGLFRKLAPSFLSIFIFFFKDILIFYALIQLVRFPFWDINLKVLSKFLKLIIVLFYPLLVINVIFDPILIPWGLKQYVFYGVIGMVLIAAFRDQDFDKLLKFIKQISLLIIPTVVVALLQLQLPSTHWLNKAVDGGDLSGFAAAGFLRVSSTFSFTGQFSYFLHFISVFIFSLLYFPEIKKQKLIRGGIQRILPIFYIIFLILGIFVTGGRTAVFGAASVLGFGLFFSLFKNKQFVLKKSILPIFGLILSLAYLPLIMPDAFAAYSKRSQGNKGQTNTEEIQGRIFRSFTGGIEGLNEESNFITILFGKGLGVMTNGVSQISSYAAAIRAHIWTETDFATTSWEGGLYLVLVWYSFRIYMIYFCFKRWRSIEDKGISMAEAFLLGYVIVTGLVGTLSLQAPVSIYWWLAIGLIIKLSAMDQNIRKYENDVFTKHLNGQK